MARILGDVAAGSTLVLDFNTVDPSTKVPYTLAGTPAVGVWQDGTKLALGSPPSVIVDRENADAGSTEKTGSNWVVLNLSSDALFTAGSDYVVKLTAGTVNGVSVAEQTIATFSIVNRETVLRDESLTVDKFATGLFATDADIADAVWDEPRADHATADTFGEGVASVIGGINTGSGTVTTLDGLDTNLSNDIAALNDLDSSAVTAACASALTTYDPPTRTEATADKDAILAALPSSGPSAAAIADAMLDETLADHSTAGSVGKAIIDALADTNELQTDWTNGGRLDLILDGVAAGGSAPTVEEIVDGLLDEPVASHATAGSVGAAIGASSTTETRDLEPVQHVWRFSRRSGGDIVAGNVLNIAPGETIRAGFECAASIVLPQGAVLATMTAATPSSGDIMATKLGIDATQAKVSVVAADDATAGETHYVRCEVTNSLGGGPLVLLGPVTVRAEPS